MKKKLLAVCLFGLASMNASATELTLGVGSEGYASAEIMGSSGVFLSHMEQDLDFDSVFEKTHYRVTSLGGTWGDDSFSDGSRVFLKAFVHSTKFMEETYNGLGGSLGFGFSAESFKFVAETNLYPMYLSDNSDNNVYHISEIGAYVEFEFTKSLNARIGGSALGFNTRSVLKDISQESGYLKLSYNFGG